MCQLSAPPVTGASRENVAALSDAPLAIFLDVDGTLLDLAERPDEAVTPPGLVATLARTERKLGGALALISGRSIEDLDRLFKPRDSRRRDSIRSGRAGDADSGSDRVASIAVRGASARGRGVSGRVRRKQALQFGCSLSPRPCGGIAAAQDCHAVHRLFAHCGRSFGCALRDRTQASRVRQRPRDCGLSVAAVGRPRPGAIGLFAEPPAVRDWLAEFARRGNGA